MRQFFIFFIFFVSLFPLTARAQCTDPAGVPGDILYSVDHDVFQGCTERGWRAFHNPSIPVSGCPNIGDTCSSDGTIYAGVSADDGKKMYIAASDSPSSMRWSGNNGINTAMVNCTGGAWSQSSCQTGEANTALLAGLSDAAAPYTAALYCFSLVAHGHDDWYLPAANEMVTIASLNAMFPPKGNLQNGAYWTSSEYGTAFGVYYDMVYGSAGGDTKGNTYPVRCARK